MGMAVWDIADSEYYKYQSFNALWVAMMLFGSGTTMYYAISAVDMLMDLFVRDSVQLEEYGAGKGYWAGCTDSIGREMALQLADKGFNIILLSHSLSEVTKVQEEIDAKGVSTRACVVDFTQCSKQQWQEISNTIKNERVGVLVNNIGICHPKPTYFDEEDKARCDSMVMANIASLMRTTRIVVPQMQERKKGLILNMGSFAATRSLPFLSVYAGTKGFVKTFSQSLAYELEPDNIMVSHIYNHWGVGSMFGSKARSFVTPSPSHFVQCVLDRLGLKCGAHDSHTSIPYYPHSILNFISSCLWDPVHAKHAHYGFGRHMYELGQAKSAKHETSSS